MKKESNMTRHHTLLPQVRHPIDLDAIEHEISDVASNAVLPDIGKLSADAVLAQYRMAAKAIEAMGEEVQQRVRALEAAQRECDEDMKLLKDAADAVREKGRHAHAEIERTAAVSKDIREIVAASMAKLV